MYFMEVDYAQRQTAFRSSGIGNYVVDLFSDVNNLFISLIAVLPPLLRKANVVGCSSSLTEVSMQK